MKKIIGSKWFFGTTILLTTIDAYAAPVAAFMAAYGSYIGMAMTAISAISQASSEKNSANYNAKIADQNATAARLAADANAKRQKVNAEKSIGSMEAAFSASGVSSNEGSAIDVMAESARNAELDYQTIKHGGELQALGYENTARLERSRASNAMSKGYMSAAGSLIGGASKAFSSFGSSASLPTVQSAPVGISSSDIGTGGSLGFGNLYRTN